MNSIICQHESSWLFLMFHLLNKIIKFRKFRIYETAEAQPMTQQFLHSITQQFSSQSHVMELVMWDEISNLFRLKKRPEHTATVLLVCWFQSNDVSLSFNRGLKHIFKLHRLLTLTLSYRRGVKAQRSLSRHVLSDLSQALEPEINRSGSTCGLCPCRWTLRHLCPCLWLRLNTANSRASTRRVLCALTSSCLDLWWR